MKKRLTAKEAEMLRRQIQREFNDKMQHFTHAVNEMQALYRLQTDPEQKRITGSVIMKLQDSYLATAMLRNLTTDQADALEVAIEQANESEIAYDEGWDDRLKDVLKRVGSEDPELRLRIERILRRRRD